MSGDSLTAANDDDPEWEIDPRMGIVDTHPDAERVMTEGLRRMSASQKWRRLQAMMQFAVNTRKNLLANDHPDLSRMEINLLWAEIHYGEELAQQLRGHVQRSTAVTHSS